MTATIPPGILAACKQSELKTKVPACVSVAQWALESAWGAHAPGNNPFGMKPRVGKNDPQQLLWTWEHRNGKDVYVLQPFRTFPSIDAAIEAHAELLSTAPVYAPAMSKLPNVSAFIYAMAPKYATDPQYANKLFSIIKAHGLNS